MNKIAGIYDPYLDTLGGGERYCLSVAELLINNGYDVDLFWSGDQNVITKAQNRFNLKLSDVKLIPDIFKISPQNIDLIENTENLTKITSSPKQQQDFYTKIKSFYTKYITTSKYDIFFYLSDWSLPFLFSKNNILHIQVPFNTSQTFLDKFLNSVKIKFLKNIICNSNFTQNYASKIFGHKCKVIYPPVDVEKFSSSSKKDNIIISVGRFDNLLNTKRQDILITAFKKIFQQNKDTTWKLVLAGGSMENEEKNVFLQHLKYLSSGFPVEFFINPEFVKLKELYSVSKIYWHAAGFEVDQTLHPENTEHFGISPVEAMASGLVPVLVSKGGLPEIIDDDINGYLWSTLDDLISKTQLLIASPEKLATMSQNAQKRAKDFSKEKFSSDFISLLNQ